MIGERLAQILCVALTGLLVQECSTFKFLTDLINMETTVMVKCLLEDQFYHSESRSCQTPFTQALCAPGEWLMVDTENIGTVTCQLRPERFNDCEAGFEPSGETECQQKEDSMFKPCEDGVIIPGHFIVNTRPCPDGFTCQERNAQYWAAKRVFELVAKEKLEEEQRFLDNLDCDTEKNLICLPAEQPGSEPLISSKNLVKTFQRLSTDCKSNPCPSEKWPWLDSDGFYNCLPASESVRSCHYVPVEKNGELHCQVLGLHSILGYLKTSKCNRQRVYRRGRCRPKFFGK